MGLQRVVHGKKATICKPKGEASEETNRAGTLPLDFSHQEYEKIIFCYLNHPVCDILL